MLSEKMQKALNEQVNAELYSAFLYLSMSAYFASANLKGFANWMRVQFQEEMLHALKIYDFINGRSGRALLSEIQSPPTEWDSTLEVFQATLEHEQKVTSRINDLVNLAIDEKDHATNNFLQWFVSEQVEEEASAEDILQRLKLIGDDGSGVFMLDRELALRIFTPPPTTTATTTG